MATIFESRPRSNATPVPAPSAPDPPDENATAALDALEAAAKELMKVTVSQPAHRRRAAELLAFHARRLERHDYDV